MATSKIPATPTVVLMTKRAPASPALREFPDQDVVGDVDRAAHIQQEIMDIAANAARHIVGIEGGRGKRGMAVEPLVEVEEEAVHRLQRIVRRRRFLIAVARRSPPPSG